MEKTLLRSRLPMTFSTTAPVRTTGPRVFTKSRLVTFLVAGICYLFVSLLMSCSRISNENDISASASTITSSMESYWLSDGAARAAAFKELSNLRYDAMDIILKDADVALRNDSVYSVILKPQVAPSGDAHDYLSLAKYFWRNPDTPDGLPYIRRDGYVNPEVETVQDYRLLRQMLREVYRLGLAFQLTGNETYAVKASDRLYEWFVNPETKMNPHFHWGSLRKGNTHGSRTGILDMYPIYRVFQIVPHLQNSPSYSPQLHNALVDWFSQYWEWLSTSSLAAQESKGVNNHGTYYDVQVIPIARFLNKHDVAKEIATHALSVRINRQIKGNGWQHHETSRPTSWFYSVFNLQGLFLLAQQCQMSGVDMWHYVGPEGQSLKTALDYLIPFALSQGEGWPYSNLNGYPVTNLVPLVEIGYIKWGDETYLHAMPSLRAMAEKERDTNHNTRPLSDFFCQMSELLGDNEFVC
ncbi:unnamed protein product [Umbelopsis ramanniana]